MIFSRHSRRLSTAVLSTLMMALAACSSSDNNNNNNNNGSTPPPTSNPNPNPPAPTLSRLTLTGTVTDAPIANAVVTATVGAETFTVNADANGNYSLEIEIEEGATDGFVTLSARGVGSQSYVEFTSLAGTFASLQSQAGSDQTLSNTENFATQITNVSTAQAVLLREANDGQPVTSEALLRSLSANLNSQEVLDLATAIKLLVDDADNYPMPDGETSLLDLISDSTEREQFVDATYNQNPAMFSSTQSAIVNDSALTQPVSAETLPASLTAAMLSDATDFTFNYSNRVHNYTFNTDGTGTAAAGDWHRQTTWTVEGSSVVITYGSTVEVTSYEPAVCPGDAIQTEVTYTSNGVKLTLLSDRVLAITETSEISYPCDIEPRTETTTVARTILSDDDFEVLGPDDLDDSSQSIYVYVDGLGVRADVADLNADGTGTTWAFNKSFTWALDATSRIVDISFDDGSVGRYRSLGEVDLVTTDLFYEIETPSARFVDAGASVYADPELPLVFNPAEMPGRFYQFGMGIEGSSDSRTKGFRLRFNDGGAGSLENDRIDGDDLMTETDSNSPSLAFSWIVDGEDVVIQHTYHIVDDVYGCALIDADCIVWDMRHLVPLARNGNRYYWMEYRQTAPPAGTLDQGIPTTLVRFYDYEPLGAPAIVSHKSAELSARKLRFNGASRR
ncbi:carboxypeptidase regulatory-like domain-containing protein [Steroidobacter sp. S1-65]|uniref:Carboxypeptidase regulatory-like domain-containing protein n=1 Tax=Steroidobacter gossypii TaxID=2805490 RepID=A0ABS1X4H2_9GAMM|nr:carboxypeptidase-like regulatory domain-containing protein [Steroidobacter gossypii]MBM0108126.1 carboxypeptidase regulatory-like domain-containing protein [Steroidobacter gossypii]